MEQLSNVNAVQIGVSGRRILDLGQEQIEGCSGRQLALDQGLLGRLGRRGKFRRSMICGGSCFIVNTA